MPTNATTTTLTRARFFVEQARLAIPADREAFQHYIEAAIVFGRSVTFHLQKQYSQHPRFTTWYSVQQSAMSSDPIFAFFRDKRNYLLNEGPLLVHSAMIIAVYEPVMVSDVIVDAHVTRAQPWYRRPLRMLWQDARARILRTIQRRRDRRLARMRSQPRQHTSSEIREMLYVEEPMWKGHPA